MAYTMTHGMMTHYKMTLDKKKKKTEKPYSQVARLAPPL
jgi:hypothetical protein